MAKRLEPNELEVKNYRSHARWRGCSRSSRKLVVRETRLYSWSNFFLLEIRPSIRNINTISNLFFMAQVYDAERGGMAEERKKSVLKGTKRNISPGDYLLHWLRQRFRRRSLWRHNFGWNFISRRVRVNGRHLVTSVGTIQTYRE